jgi:hypothetical protein
VPAVKQRIRAIKNIGKITKAMKMVAASKMRNAQVAVEKSRGIVEPFVRLFGDYPGACAGRGLRQWLLQHGPGRWAQPHRRRRATAHRQRCRAPLLQRRRRRRPAPTPPPPPARPRPRPAAIAPPKQVAVAVTSDKGLCGGLNSNITKYSKVLMAMTPEGEGGGGPGARGGGRADWGEGASGGARAAGWGRRRAPAGGAAPGGCRLSGHRERGAMKAPGCPAAATAAAAATLSFENLAAAAAAAGKGEKPKQQRAGGACGCVATCAQLAPGRRP